MTERSEYRCVVKEHYNGKPFLIFEPSYPRYLLGGWGVRNRNEHQPHAQGTCGRWIHVQVAAVPGRV